MNNVDVSIINVLKTLHPEIFGIYFNTMGSIPNPTQETHRKASALFQAYTPETFDSFMERYRNWIRLLEGPPETSSSPEDEEEEEEEEEVEDYSHQGDPTEEIEIESMVDFIQSRRRAKKPEFDVSSFLMQKTMDREYASIDFDQSSDRMRYHPGEIFELKDISNILTFLNKTSDYKILHVHYNEII